MIFWGSWLAPRLSFQIPCIRTPGGSSEWSRPPKQPVNIAATNAAAQKMVSGAWRIRIVGYP